LALGLALAVVLIVGADVGLQLKTAIAAIAETYYPGRRVVAGGTMPIWHLGAHMMPWTVNEGHFPAGTQNVCEGAGFLWLAPIALLGWRQTRFSSFQRAVLISLLVLFVALVCWVVVPMPSFVGHPFGLDRCVGQRVTPALGLVNIAITMLIVSRYRRESLTARSQVWILSGSAVAFYLLLWAVSEHFNHFFFQRTLIVSALYLAIVTVCLLGRRQWNLAMVLLAPQALLFGAVNPVVRGLPVYTRSELMGFVQHHPELLDGKWLVYSDVTGCSGFLAATGLDVYTGTHYLPDIDHLSLLAEDGADLKILNRLGFLDAHAVPAGTPPTVSTVNPVIVKWSVPSNDAILPKLGIRYVAFDAKPDPDLTTGLTPVSDRAWDGFWLYRLQN
jgi:hypothetical protein